MHQLTLANPIDTYIAFCTHIALSKETGRRMGTFFSFVESIYGYVFVPREGSIGTLLASVPILPSFTTATTITTATCVSTTLSTTSPFLP